MHEEETRNMQIGDVAARTGLSLRTVRYYEEAGLVTPCARTGGGFRLYSVAECEKLELIKRLKPLGFSLEEIREMLGLLDHLENDESDRVAQKKLRVFTEATDAHVRLLEEQLRDATEFAAMLRERAGVVSGDGNSADA